MRRQLGPLGRSLRSSLFEMTPRDHRQSAREFRRRQVVSVVVVVIGAVVLGFSLQHPAGELRGVLARDARCSPPCGRSAPSLSGPLHLGRIGHPAEPDLAAPRPVVQPLVIGALLSALFVVGAFVITGVPWLDTHLSPFIEGVLKHTQQGSAAGPAGGHGGQRDRRGAVLPRGDVRRDPPPPGGGDHGRLHRGHPRDRQRDAGLRRDPARRRRRPPAPRHRRHPRADPDPPDLVGDDALRAAGDLPRATRLA